MAAAVSSSSVSLTSATRGLPGSTTYFACSYQKRRVQMVRVRCAADGEGEISPLLPSSCRYVPTCSEYSMQAYKRYGVGKGTILTAWRLCRCNPIGGQGYDPPRWFGEEVLPEE